MGFRLILFLQAIQTVVIRGDYLRSFEGCITLVASACVIMRTFLLGLGGLVSRGAGGFDRYGFGVVSSCRSPGLYMLSHLLGTGGSLVPDAFHPSAVEALLVLRRFCPFFAFAGDTMIRSTGRAFLSPIEYSAPVAQRS